MSMDMKESEVVQTAMELVANEIPLRRECLALIEEAERRAKDNNLGDAAYRNAMQRLKLFLRDGRSRGY